MWLKAYSVWLRELRSAGLTAQSQFLLLRTYANGAVVHLLRANHVLEQWCVSWDNEVVAYLQELLHRTLRQDQRLQVFLPLAQGGLGFASASARRSAAFLGSWEQSLHDVAPAVGVASASRFFADAIGTHQALQSACTNLQTQGVPAPVPWERRFRNPVRQHQKLWSQRVNDHAHATLLEELTEDQRAELRSAGGGRRSWQLPPPSFS